MKLPSRGDFEGVVPSSRIAFKIEANAMMVDILSNLIYKDKVLAVIRELSCNAYDSHVAAGNKKPFKVQVPTKLEPVFAVEDEGTGLPADKIGDIFWTYGKSTKTETNDQIGAMGIGSKSPFAYTKSSFIVRSRFDGVETHYMCFINEKGTPDGAVTAQEPTDKPNGIRVELGVRSEDVGAFHHRIRSFFRYWRVKPELVNAPNNFDWAFTKPAVEGTGWYIESAESEDHLRVAKAVMGNVAYPIAAAAIPNPSQELRFVANNSFIIEFPLGELAFAASREELSYDNATVAALERGAKRVMSEFYGKLISEVKSYSGTPLDTMTRLATYRFFIERNYGYDVLSKTARDLSVTAAGGMIIKETKRSVVVGSKTMSSLAMYDLVMTRSGRSVRLSPAREVTLTKTETKVVDTVTNKTETRERTKTMQWFSPATKPKKTLSGTTAGDALHEGFVHKETTLKVTVPEYGSVLKLWEENVGIHVIFVLNDVGARGSAAVKNHFLTNGNREMMSRVIFVDYDDPKNAPADLGKDEIESMLKGTLVEGATIVPLTKLPGFQMPKVEPREKRDPTPKATSPKGWVEVRRVTFAPKGETLTPLIGQNRFSFKKLGETASDYVKVDPTKLTSLYTLTAAGGMDKALRVYMSDAIFAYAFHSGALDSFADFDEHGKRTGISFIVRNAEDIESLKKKGAALTEMNALRKLIEEIDTSSVMKHLGLINRMSSYGSSIYQLVHNGVLGTPRKILTARIAPDSFFHQVAKMVDDVNDFFKDNNQRCALAALATSKNSDETKKAERELDKTFTEFKRRYPLLSSLDRGTMASGGFYDSIVAYVDMEDKRHAAVKAEEEAKAAAVKAEEEAKTALGAAAAVA